MTMITSCLLQDAPFAIALQLLYMLPSISHDPADCAMSIFSSTLLTYNQLCAKALQSGAIVCGTLAN
jgi:hypothetical protein